MRLDTLADWQRVDVERRLAKGHGEIITIKYTDLEEQVVPLTDEEAGGGAGAVRKLMPVERERQYYIGRMSPGQTSTVLGILGRVFFGGMGNDEEEEEAEEGEEKKEESKVNFSFTGIMSYLDDATMTHLFATILHEEEGFVYENWDMEWVADVFATFVRYNDFFKLLDKVTDIATSITTPLAPPTIQRIK